MTDSWPQPAFPTRSVTTVAPFTPGTPADVAARRVAQAMTGPLSQSVVVENRSGAGGTTGSEYVARAQPDGYTLIAGTQSTHAINVALYRNLHYHPTRSFAPISRISAAPNVVVVPAALKVGTMKDLIALSLHERLLVPCEKVLGPDHKDTAFHLSGLASCVQAQGDLAGARLLHERALAICENVLPPQHPITARCLNGLAILLHDQGDFVGARLLHERACAIREKLVPAGMATAQSLSELANLLGDEGDLLKARTYFERALATFEMISHDHPNTNRVRRNFARLLVAAGSAAEALTLGETALAGHEKVLGKNHRWTKDSARTTADAFAALGRADEAAALRERYGFEPDTWPAA